MKKFIIVLSLIITALTSIIIGSLVAGQPGQAMLVIAAVTFTGSIAISLGMPRQDMAYAICGNIARGIQPNCAFPMVNGLEIDMYLANKADIAGYTQDVSNHLLISAITMNTIYTVTYSGLTGVFSPGEQVSDGTNSGTIQTDNGATIMVVGGFVGTPPFSGTLTGSVSGATATFVSEVSSSAKFYKYEGIKTSNEGKGTAVLGKYVTNFDHELDLVVFAADPATKFELDKMAKGVLVGIIEYKCKGQGGNAAFEIFGLEQGLEVTKMERDSTNKDTQGGYSIQLKTLAGYTEPHLPRTLYSTDYATTLAIVNGLL